jgi:hypothetical protein
MTYEIETIDTVQGRPVIPFYRVTGWRSFRCESYADAAFLCTVLNNATNGQIETALAAATERTAA